MYNFFYNKQITQPFLALHYGTDIWGKNSLHKNIL